MGSVADTEALDVARQLAGHFARASARKGWTLRERLDLEQAVSALWRARGVLQGDVSSPDKRKRRARLEPPAPLPVGYYTAKMAAQQLGLSAALVRDRAKLLGVGQHDGAGKWRFDDRDLSEIASAGNL